MKIAFFSDSFFPHLSGVTVSLYNFSQALVKRGHQVLIFAPHPDKKRPKPKLPSKLKIEWLPSIKSFYPDLRIGAPTPRSFLKLKRFDPDLIHVYTPFLIGGEGIVGAKLLKKPLVYTFNTYYMDPETFKIFGIKRRLKPIEKALWSYERRITKSAKVIIAPTQFVADDLKKHHFPSRVEVVPTGINLARVGKKKADQRRLKHVHDLHGKIILGVGRISEEKNWEFLLSVVHYLYQREKRYTLVLIGKGPAEEELRFLARILKLEHRVRFLGAIPYDELIDGGYYCIGDVFAMPSTWETQGLVTLEAMAFGLPIVALKSKGTISLVGKSGLLVKEQVNNFSMAIDKVLSNSGFAKKLSKQSSRRAQDFCIKRLSAKMEEVYKSVL